jgi:hypothetical protein
MALRVSGIRIRTWKYRPPKIIDTGRTDPDIPCYLDFVQGRAPGLLLLAAWQPHLPSFFAVHCGAGAIGRIIISA